MAAINPEVCKRYGTEVRAASLESGVLELPNGFVGDSELPPLWLHPNYLLLEDFLVRNARSGNPVAGRRRRKRVKNHFHLVATPGIGKTYFGYYWFFKQAKEGKRVIWRTKGEVFLYYDFSLEDPFVCSSPTYIVLGSWAGPELLDPIWLIIDGSSKSVDHKGFVLQCVSQGRSGYKDFAKDTGMLLHLEAWTLEELMECRDRLDLDFTDAALTQRFYYCGGLAREVLDETKTMDDLKSVMTKAVSRAPSWETLIRHAASDMDKEKEISDYLLHYQLVKKLDLNSLPCECVRHFSLKFGSDFVEDLVVDAYRKQGYEKVREFFNFCQEIPEAAHGLSGKFFERYVHKNLQDNGGGDYRVKDLLRNGNPVSTLTLRPTSIKRLRRWEIGSRDVAGRPIKPSKDERLRGLIEVQFSVYNQETTRADAVLGNEESTGFASLGEGCFVSPYSATFKSLDSFVVPKIMIQCTYSLNHKLFWDPVLEIVQEYDRWHASRNLPLPTSYSLIFIVPECQFESFMVQGYKKDDGSDYVVMQPAMARVHQFALAFPW